MIHHRGWQTMLEGQIRPAACFYMACKLKKIFTFFSGWGENHKNMISRQVKVIEIHILVFVNEVLKCSCVHTLRLPLRHSGRVE